MKICGSQLVGKVLGFFLMWHFCSNGHVVNGQVVRLDSAEVSNDLQTLTLRICFAEAQSGSGTINFTADQNIFHFASQEATQTLLISNAQQCGDYPITVAIQSDKIGLTTTVSLQRTSSSLMLSQNASDTSHVVTIPGVFLDPVIYTTQEGSNRVSLSICRFPLTIGVITTLMYADGTADAGSDYTASPQPVLIQIGDRCATALIPIIDDQIIEENETFTVSIFISQPSSLMVSSSQGTATVTIMDNDGGVFFHPVLYSTSEDNSLVILSICRLPTTSSLSATLMYTDGTADAGFDYTALPQSVEIQSGVQCETVSISVTDDDIIEGAETFTVSVSISQPSSLMVSPSQGTATVSILDNDEGVYFHPILYTTLENSFASVSICRYPITDVLITTLMYTDGTADAGSDFVASQQSVVIQIGDQCASASIPIIDDDIIEGAETFTVSVSISQPSSLMVSPSQGIATVTIMDNDVGTLEVSALNPSFSPNQLTSEHNNMLFLNLAVSLVPDGVGISGTNLWMVEVFLSSSSSGQSSHLATAITTLPYAALNQGIAPGMMSTLSNLQVNLDLTNVLCAQITYICVRLTRNVNSNPLFILMSSGGGSGILQCQEITCQPSPCASDPCKNGGTCSVVNNSFQCACENLFFGETCQSTLALNCPLDLRIITGVDDNKASVDLGIEISCSSDDLSCNIDNMPIEVLDVEFTADVQREVSCECGRSLVGQQMPLTCSFLVTVIVSTVGHRFKRDDDGASNFEIGTPVFEDHSEQTMTTSTQSGTTEVTIVSTDIMTTTAAGQTVTDEIPTMSSVYTTAGTTVEAIYTEAMTTVSTSFPRTTSTNTDATITDSILSTIVKNDTADATTPALNTSTAGLTTEPMTTVHPCNSGPCDENAECTLNEETFKCTCDDGYTGDGEKNGSGCTACSRTSSSVWMYGPNCSLPCTCAYNINCDIMSGECSGACNENGPFACDKNNLDVTIANDSVTVNENQSFSLVCMVNLGPDDVTVTWEDPAGNITQSDVNTETMSSTLTITDATAKDGGKYTCTGTLNAPTDNMTSVSDSVDVNVKDFPEIASLKIAGSAATSLTVTWQVIDNGQDDVNCTATYNGDNERATTPCEEDERCEIGNLTPDTEYDISVVCYNDAGPSNTETTTGRTSRSTPSIVPDLQPADTTNSVNSTSIVVELSDDISEENGEIRCYEFVVAVDSPSDDPDDDYPFNEVLPQSGVDELPYRAVVMNRSTFIETKKVVIGIASSPVTTCELTDPTAKRKRRALITPQTLRATNGPLKSEQTYHIFLRVYVPSGESYDYESSDYMEVDTAKAPTSGSPGAIIAVLIILIIIIIVLVVVVLFIYRKRRVDSEHARGNGEIMVLQENGINDQPDSSGTVNEGIENNEIEKVEPINIDELGNQILEKHQNNSRIFNAEFRSLLDVNPDTTFETFSRPANAEKNRYINIYCYDHSRVKLEEIDDVEHSDYINANYIDGYNVSNKFIAAQGPKSETVEDHWRMLWQQNTATVIMLTRCFEDGGREKCAQYWPDKGSQTFGVFTVHLDSIAECPDYVIRKFRVTKEGEEEGTYHTITQFHYLAWPDHGVPEYPYKMLAFIKRIRQMTPAKPEKGNIVIHCSAGVGRTGTYITIDAMLDRLREEKTVDIYNFIQSMRLNRRLLVQTVVQYIFIYHALHEEHLYGHTEIDLAGLHHYFRRLRLKTHSEDNSPLHNEFKTAATLPVKDTNSSEASVQANVEKNRTRNYLPYDRNRVKLERLVGDENSTYINASYINGYERKNMYITTQAPMENTTHDFWRMVWESLTSTIVMLTDLEEKGNEMCVKFWPEEEAKTFGNLTVELTSENEEDDYTTMEFIISNTEGVATRKVKMYRFHGWPEVGAPKCCEAVCDLVNVAHEHQRGAEREESAEQSKHPIVVFCHTGVGRTAVWVALAILMERARAEGVVDVFQTVRTLRQQRQHMIQDATQYEFLYEAVLRHLDTLDQYANFR